MGKNIRHIKFKVETVNDAKLSDLPFAIGNMVPKATDGYVKTRKEFKWYYLAKESKDFNAMVFYEGKMYNFEANIKDVFAVPVKENCLLEIMLSIFLMCLFFLILPANSVSEGRIVGGFGLAAIMGWLIGSLRINKQKSAARYFNDSQV